MKRFRLLAALLLMACLLLPLQAAMGKSYEGERFDVDLVIESDGALLVTETVVFQFAGGPYTYAFRQLQRDDTDSIEILSAAMDGVELPQGVNAGQVEIAAGGNPIDVRWHFDPISDQARTFTLKYRVLGATRVAGDSDLVKWFVLPSDHEYKIRSSTVTVHLPESKSISGAIELSGAAWESRSSAGLWVASASDIPANQSAELTLAFPRGSLLSQPPAWQAARLERASQTRAALPWSAGLGFIVLLAGAIGLEGFWRKNHPGREESFQQGVITRPPDGLNPAMAGALISLPGVPLELAVATLLDLARRGWVRLEQSEKKRGLFSQNRFEVMREERVNDVSLEPYEQIAYELVFDREPGKRQGTDSVELPKAVERLQRGLHYFSNKVSEGMLAAGLQDAGRRQKRKRVLVYSVLGMFLFLLLFFISLALIGAIWQNRAFNGALLMGFAIAGFTLSLAGLAMGGNFHVLTEKGQHARKQWQGFGDYLKAQIRSDKGVLQVEWLDAYLPYAVALHFGDRWAKAFKDRGLQPQLAWLRAMDDLQAADVVVMMAVISSSSGSDGGGAAGGGGGGASGAG